MQDKSTDASDYSVYTSEEGLENNDNSLGDLDHAGTIYRSAER